MRSGRLLVGVAALAGLVSASWAQSALEVLHQASQAQLDVGTVKANLTIHGEGADLFKDAMPKGQATLLVRKIEIESAEEDAPTSAWIARISGTTTTGNTKEPEPVQFDLIRRPDSYRWIDHKDKKVYDMPTARVSSSRSLGYTAARMLIPAEMLTPTPFEDEINASELTLLDPIEVGGTSCDVVEATYPESKGRPTRTNQKVRLAFGKDDHLLRRIDRISGTGAFMMSLVLEMTDIQPGVELGDSDFELAAPEGYELSESTLRPKTVTANASGHARHAEGIGLPADAQTKRPEPVEHFEFAPAFSTKLANGSELSVDALSGHAAVLYFWGTWCIECRAYNEELSKLSQDYAGDGVRVIGMAVRERDPHAAADLVRVRDYKFEVAPDAASAAEAFDVVVYPTFVVLDAQGHLIGTERVRHSSTTDDVVGRVRSLLDKALGKAPAQENDSGGSGSDTP